jgi:4-hydroxybenzoate polyprenyltransferase
LKKVRLILEFARPFTLLAPFIGFFSWGLAAFGAQPEISFSVTGIIPVLIGAVMASSLNVASNGINQIFDIEIDRMNKPERPLPSGRLSLTAAWVVAITFYGLALLLAWFIAPTGAHQCFVIVLIAAVCTVLYSAPPARTKRFIFLSNLTIALPRGALLVVAGWSAVRNIFNPEPWYLALIFGAFIFGAATTKDFSDIEGDKKGGCNTLPVCYGVKKAAYITALFFIFPFILIPLGVMLGVLSAERGLVYILGGLLIAYGAFIGYLLVRRPEELATERNHISWKHMYLEMMVAQVGFAVVYLLS